MNRPDLLHRVQGRLRTERDIFAWRRLLAPLRDSERPAAERSVLFCELWTMTATAKVGALMAGLLRLKGYRPVVLLERRNRAIEEIFRAAAPDTIFIDLESAITSDLRQASECAAEAIMARTTTLRDLVRLEVDGFRIGRNVLSLVLRRFRVGRLDDADSGHRVAARQTLARSLAVKNFIERLLAARAPDIAVFVERGYTPAGEVFDGCLLRGVDVVQWCGAPQSDRLIYRRYSLATRGEHPLALSEPMWNHMLHIPWSAADDRAVCDRIAANYESGAWYNRQQLQQGKAIFPRDALQRILDLDRTKKTAVIFSHILYDATFFYGDGLFEDYEHWLVETVRAAIANPRLNWLVKVHPANAWRSKMDGAALVQLESDTLLRHFGQLPSHVKLIPADAAINTFSLFSLADYGLTVRGTIGMELPCFGIPVVTAGSGRYSGKGFTIDPPTRETYMALMANLESVPQLDGDSVRRARLHYYGALELRPVPMKSFTIEHGSPQSAVSLGPTVVIKQRPDSKLLETDDLGRFIRWVVDTNTPELLKHDL